MSNPGNPVITYPNNPGNSISSMLDNSSNSVDLVGEQSLPICINKSNSCAYCGAVKEKIITRHKS